MLLVFLLPVMAGMIMAQMEPMGCGTSTPTASSPACTLTFHPWMAPDIAPTRTVAAVIEVMSLDVSASDLPTCRANESLQILDCQYCTVTNLPYTITYPSVSTQS